MRRELVEFWSEVDESGSFRDAAFASGLGTFLQADQPYSFEAASGSKASSGIERARWKCPVGIPAMRCRCGIL